MGVNTEEHQLEQVLSPSKWPWRPAGHSTRSKTKIELECSDQKKQSTVFKYLLQTVGAPVPFLYSPCYDFACKTRSTGTNPMWLRHYLFNIAGCVS